MIISVSKLQSCSWCEKGFQLILADLKVGARKIILRMSLTINVFAVPFNVENFLEEVDSDIFVINRDRLPKPGTVSADIHVVITKFRFYVPFNSQGHIGTGPQHCHLWE